MIFLWLMSKGGENKGMRELQRSWLWSSSDTTWKAILPDNQFQDMTMDVGYPGCEEVKELDELFRWMVMSLIMVGEQGRG